MELTLELVFKTASRIYHIKRLITSDGCILDKMLCQILQRYGFRM
jgi:hypothetical protein